MKNAKYYISECPETKRQFLVQHGKDNNIIELTSGNVKAIKQISEHTPKQIIEQCILRWTLSADDGEFEHGELKQWTEAAETILSEFENGGKNGSEDKDKED